jgi:hypothetical protein
METAKTNNCRGPHPIRLDPCAMIDCRFAKVHHRRKVRSKADKPKEAFVANTNGRLVRSKELIDRTSR